MKIFKVKRWRTVGTVRHVKGWNVWTEHRGEAERFRDHWKGIDPSNRAEVLEMNVIPTRKGIVNFLNKHGEGT